MPLSAAPTESCVLFAPRAEDDNEDENEHEHRFAEHEHDIVWGFGTLSSRLLTKSAVCSVPEPVPARQRLWED